MNEDQKSAMKHVIGYLRYQADKKLSMKEIAGICRINIHTLNNFMADKSHMHDESIYESLYQYLIQEEIFIPTWIRSIFLTAFPGHPNLSKTLDSVLHDSFVMHSKQKEQDVSKFLTEYSGVYSVVRYAAHLDTPEKDPAKLKENAYVVRAVMRIYKSSDNPLFIIKYKHSFGISQVTEITGAIMIRENNEFVLVGAEQYTNYPVLIFISGLSEIERLLGVVLRKHRKDNKILSGKVMFKRLNHTSRFNEDAIFDRESKKIGVVRESDVTDMFDKSELRRVLNKTVPCGKSMLVL